MDVYCVVKQILCRESNEMTHFYELVFKNVLISMS